MAASGTYSFSPSVGELVLTAFGRCQIRRSEITQQHLADAAMEANLLQVELSNRQPNLWEQELYEVELEEGVATYTLPARFISPMAVYITTNTGDDASTFDRILGPLSTFEYSAMPNKTVQAPPTSFWFRKETAPEVWLWPVPDQDEVYTLKMQLLSQIQDANLPSGVTPNVPYLWLDAFMKKLSVRLAEIYKPDMVQQLDMQAERAWQLAATQGVEEVPIFLIPGLQNYWT